MEKIKLKRYGVAILAATLISGMIPLQGFAAGVTGHWAEETMKRWEREGLLKGDGSGSLRPDDPIVRAEFMALANRALGLNKESDSVKKYKDVEQSAWYYADVAKALEAGYITGTSHETISPLNHITNEQAYTISAHIAKAEGTADLRGVADNGRISAWAKKSVEQAIAGGYISGYKGKINPQEQTTRAQAIIFLDRVKNGDKVFAFPGTYAVKSARNITVHVNDVVLKDTVVSGDLTLGPDVTEIRLENTKIEGRIVKRNADAKVVQNFLWRDGTFEGIAEGQNGPIRAQIKVEEGKIKEVKILEHKENASSLNNMKRVLKQIVERGNLDNIDLGTDKTINSRGFLNAVKDAASQSGGETKKPGESKASQEHRSLKDGAYEGVARGYGGPMRLEIKIKGGKITSIKILDHSETRSYLKATESMIKKIIEKGDIEKIDTVSGATVSSKAILNAVKDAMSQARGKTEKAGETNAAVENNGGGGGGRGNEPTEPQKTDYSKVVLPDGDYKGKAIGYGGPISVSVKVVNGVIFKVTVDSHSETSGYYNKVLGLFDTIVKKNSTDIDTISGATVTSKGILSAVEDALSKVKGTEKKEYADGTWYGQGRGYYPADRISWGKWKTATEAVVTVLDGKITAVKLEYHGDDTGYERPEGYKLIGKHIIEHNGTEKLPEIFAKKDFKEPIYDAITGATKSAGGFVSAIDHALSRSAKYKKDGIPQEIRSISLSGPFLGEVHYGYETDLSGITLKVKYTDGREENVAFADIQEKGIKSNLPITFIPKPDDENNYEERKDMDLTFTHEKSMSKHSSNIQASRKILYKQLSRIEFTTEDGETYEVPITDGFYFDVTLKSDQFKEGTEVKVFDLDNSPVEIDKYELLTHGVPTLSIDLKPLERAKPEDKISEVYQFSTFRIRLHIKAEFDKDTITSFNVDSYPKKIEYFTGEKLDLNGLKVTAKDSNYKSKAISLADLQDNGFTVTPEEGSVLNDKGTVSVTISHINSKIPEVSFDIEVKEKTELPVKIELQASDGQVIQTIMLIEGKRVYHNILIPSEYKTKIPVVKVYNEKGDVITPYEVNFKPGATLLKVYFTEDEYAFLGIKYKD